MTAGELSQCPDAVSAVRRALADASSEVSPGKYIIHAVAEACRLLEDVGPDDWRDKLPRSERQPLAGGDGFPQCLGEIIELLRRRGHSAHTLVCMISIIVAIAVIGALVYIVTLIPMPDIFRKVIYVIACLGLLLYCLSAFGLWDGFGHVRLR